MITPAPDFSTVQEFRESNRRMAESILATEPAPYADGGFGENVVGGLVQVQAAHDIPRCASDAGCQPAAPPAAMIAKTLIVAKTLHAMGCVSGINLVFTP